MESNPVTRPKPLALAVVDDDVDVRTALARLLRSHGHQVSLFSSAEEFEANPVAADCLIVDVRLPGLSGLELRDRMDVAGALPPIVFITGDGDRFLSDASRTHAPSLHKPFDDERLIAAINEALAVTHDQR